MKIPKWLKIALVIFTSGTVLLLALFIFVRLNWESSLKIRPVVMDSELISKASGNGSTIYSELEKEFAGQAIKRVYKITNGPLKNTYVIADDTINGKDLGEKKLQFKGNARNRFGLDLATRFDGVILDGEHLQPNATLFACKNMQVLWWGCSFL